MKRKYTRKHTYTCIYMVKKRPGADPTSGGVAPRAELNTASCQRRDGTGHEVGHGRAPDRTPGSILSRTGWDSRSAPVRDGTGHAVRSGPGLDRTPGPVRSRTGWDTRSGALFFLGGEGAARKHGGTARSFSSSARALEDKCCKRRPLPWRGRSPMLSRGPGWPTALPNRIRKSSVSHGDRGDQTAKTKAGKNRKYVYM